MSELSNWPTEPEAARILGTSVKTIQRHAAKGKIEVQKRHRDGKKPENVCNPRDIEALKPSAHVMPEAASPAALVPAARPAPVPVQSDFGAFIQTIATAFAAVRPDVQIAKNLSEKLVLTLKEASGCGLSVKFLRSAVDSGSLRCFRDGRRIKIPRAALDEFVRNGGEL